jgi:hypothetical protein
MYVIESIFNVCDIAETTLQEIVERLRSQEMLDKVLAVRAAKNKEARDSLKRMLPAFTLCKFSGRADSQNFLSTRHIIYDVDGLNKKLPGGSSISPHDAIARISKLALFSFISPSGNGIKLVIQMDRDMGLQEYRYNRKYYRDILSAETGLKMDDSYNSYHTFFSHHGKTEINKDAPVFTAITPEVSAQISDVNIETANKKEFYDIAKYLSEQSLSYYDWTTVCFALQNVKGGKAMFQMITEGDKSDEHSHRDWEKKWEQCKDPTSITVGSLYHVAALHHYERKEEFIEEGRGKYLPFIIKEDGMYYKSKDKPATRVFGFSSISIQYSVYDPDDGNKICLAINGTELVTRTTTLSSASEFRKAILSSAKCNPYMITNGKSVTFYDMLFDYMDKTKSSLTVQSLRGMGKVAPGVWNFGSVVVRDGMVLPYDPLLTIGNVGYALDDVSDKISIRDNPPLLKRKLNVMHDVYCEWAATAIGWAVANVFYPEIMHEFAAFPILFMFGKTASGKTKLATIVLAMFGIKNPEKAGAFRISLTSATQTAMARVKHGSVGIPHFFDEYRNNRKDHYEMLKNFYEGAGKAMGMKTNDARIHRMEIGSGSIFAAVNKDSEAEAINRCAYIDMNNVKSNDPGAETIFQKEFMSEQGLSELSAFILHVVCEKTWVQFLIEYRKLRKFIEESLWVDQVSVDSRIQVNYAIVGAGYNLCRGLFKEHVPNEWWVLMAKQAAEYADESDPVDRFIAHVYGFAIREAHKSFIFMDQTDKDDEVILSFHVEQALIAARAVERLQDDLIRMTPRELSKQLREHPDFLLVSTKKITSDDGSYVKAISVVKMRYKIKSED